MELFQGISFATQTFKASDPDFPRLGAFPFKHYLSAKIVNGASTNLVVIQPTTTTNRNFTSGCCPVLHPKVGSLIGQTGIRPVPPSQTGSVSTRGRGLIPADIPTETPHCL
jgi:hypothetical protein